MLDNMWKALADRFTNMTILVSNSEVSEKSRIEVSKFLQLYKEKIQGLSFLKSIESDQSPAHLGPDHFPNVWRLT